MSLAWAFFKRDAIIALSYRATFIAQLVGNIFLLGVFYFIAKLIDSSSNPELAAYGGGYLGFMLVGLALTDCVGVSMTTFAGQIRDGQVSGTLETTLMTPVSLLQVLIYSSLWSYFLSAFRFVLYVGVGSLIYGVSLRQANGASVAAIFLLTVFCFAGIGILWATVVLLLKRGEALLTMIGFIVILLSGVVFPNTVLPQWLRWVSELIPLTHALHGMRLAMLSGSGLEALGPTFLKLAAFAVVMLAIGLFAFSRAVGYVKRMGSLAEF
ncbi:MAG TPA: hypothetical protein DEH78_29085 [Solibacterales bacterium]|nr:hypothetical protein [Bryobacterales bacterium]